MGINVVKYRYVHTILGGALAGIGGVFYSLAIVPTWVDGMTKGAGWIAIALVIFGFWRPSLTLLGAYLFGALQSLGSTLKARGVNISGDAQKLRRDFGVRGCCARAQLSGSMTWPLSARPGPAGQAPPPRLRRRP